MPTYAKSPHWDLGVERWSVFWHRIGIIVSNIGLLVCTESRSRSLFWYADTNPEATFQETRWQAKLHP